VKAAAQYQAVSQNMLLSGWLSQWQRLCVVVEGGRPAALMTTTGWQAGVTGYRPVVEGVGCGVNVLWDLKS
jgi:hypothetical protein